MIRRLNKAKYKEKPKTPLDLKQMYKIDINRFENKLLHDDDLTPKTRKKLNQLAEADFGEWMAHVRGGLIHAIHEMSSMTEEEKS